MDINDNINGIKINNNKNLNSNIEFESTNYYNNYNENLINNTPNNICITNPNNTLINRPNAFDFNTYLDKITSLLKDYFHNDNLYLNNIKLISESINEQTLFSRCSINDILLYLNQITYPRFNAVMANMNEKYIKEKLNLLNDRLGKIDELKDNMNQNIRNTEIELITYYEESRNTLQKLKIFYKYGNSNAKYENDLFNIEQMETLKKNYNKLLNENNRLKMDIKINYSMKGNNSVKNKDKNKKFNLALENLRNNSCSRMNTQKIYKNTNNSMEILKDELKKINNLSKKININTLNNRQYKNRNSKNKTSNNSNFNTLTLSKNIEEKNKKFYIEIIVDLASMILNFLDDMRNLQENIIKKSNNIKEFKKNFEISKKSLRIFCEKIVNHKNSPEKLKSINIKTISPSTSKINENKNNINIIIKDNNNITQMKLKITDLENNLNEKNIKIKNMESEISSYINKNTQLMKQLNEYIEKERTKKNTESNMEIMELNNIKEKNKKLTIELNNKNSKIKSLESNIFLNKQLEEENKNQKKTIEDLNNKINIEINKNSNLNKQLSQLKLNENELLAIKNENIELKKKINQNNNKIDEISSKNESTLKEKDKIINRLNMSIKELNDKINNNNKENYNKIFFDIKEILNGINIESQKSINELLDKDKNFDLFIEKNIKEENKLEIGNKRTNINEEINSKIDNIKNVANEYGKLIIDLKNYNNILQQTNNDKF